MLFTYIYNSYFVILIWRNNQKCKACSVFGNYSVAILKIIENYGELASGLQDICEEAVDLQVVSIQGKVYSITFFVGGD